MVAQSDGSKCPECNGRGVIVDPWDEHVDRCPSCTLHSLLQREQELFDAEDDDEVAAAEWVANRTHIDNLDGAVNDE